MKHILCTGFSAFPGQPDNPTEGLMHWLSGAKQCLNKKHSINLETHVLETSWVAVERFFKTHPLENYQAVLAFVVASRSRKIRLETIARNITNQHVPDARGCLSSDSYIVENGPEKLKVDNPLSTFLDALKQNEVPCRLSCDAGSYLCNAMLYKLLADKRLENSFKLFVHVPDPARKGHAINQTDLQKTAELILKSVSN